MVTADEMKEAIDMIRGSTEFEMDVEAYRSLTKFVNSVQDSGAAAALCVRIGLKIAEVRVAAKER